MEVTVVEECGKQHFYKNFQDKATVFDIKLLIEKDTGHRIDS